MAGTTDGAIARHPRAAMALAMATFGTIGLFRRLVPLSSGLLACVRGLLGAVTLALVAAAGGRAVSWRRVRPRLGVLVASGVLMGLNWVFLFEAYRYTTVAVATLCYYLAPVIVVALSPVLFGERLGPRRLACVGAALVGMVLVSGVTAGDGAATDVRGVGLGLLAAALYASVIVLNKRVEDVPATDKTVVQLVAAAAACVPYVALTDGAGAALAQLGSLAPAGLAATLVVGVVHTGLAYGLYFGSMRHLGAQVVAVFGYVDPAVALVVSGVVLGEPLGPGGLLGAALILGGAFLAERWGD